MTIAAGDQAPVPGTYLPGCDVVFQFLVCVRRAQLVCVRFCCAFVTQAATSCGVAVEFRIRVRKPLTAQTRPKLTKLVVAQTHQLQAGFKTADAVCGQSEIRVAASASMHSAMQMRSYFVRGLVAVYARPRNLKQSARGKLVAFMTLIYSGRARLQCDMITTAATWTAKIGIWMVKLGHSIRSCRTHTRAQSAQHSAAAINILGFSGQACARAAILSGRWGKPTPLIAVVVAQTAALIVGGEMRYFQ